MNFVRLSGLALTVLSGCDLAYVAVDASAADDADTALDAEVEAVAANAAQHGQEPRTSEGGEPRTSGGEVSVATTLTESETEAAASTPTEPDGDPTAPDGPVITLADLVSEEGGIDADFFHFRPAISEDGRTILVSEPVRDGTVDRLVFIELPDRRVATFVARYERALSASARARLDARLEAGRFRELPVLDVDAVIDGVRFDHGDHGALRACHENESQTCEGLDPRSLLMSYLAPLRGGDGDYAIEMGTVGELHRPQALGFMVTPDRRWLIAPFGYDFDRCTGWTVMPRFHVIPFPRNEGARGPTSVIDLRSDD